MVLYRKYRPQTFKEVIGQDHIVKTLQNEIGQGKIAHAYLFSGPRGLGKTTLARIFAKTINCADLLEKLTKKDFVEVEPCNRCSSCQEITRGMSLDLIEIDAATNRGINEIRELREQVRFSPAKERYKVFVIDECHQLTPEAFNALLKTLEEPPKWVVFILATTEIHKVPETIISRCQRFDFNKVDSKKIIGRLEKISKAEGIEVAPKVLERIVSRSEGCVRDAETILSQILTLDEKKITEDLAEIVIPKSYLNLISQFVEFIFQKNDKSALEFIDQLVEGGVDLKEFSRQAIEYLRQILLIKVGIKNDIHYDGLSEAKINQLAEKLEIKKLIEIIETIIEASRSLDSAEIPQLPLELAVVKICL